MANGEPLGYDTILYLTWLQNAELLCSYFFFQRLSANTGIRFKDLTKT